jgi:hypothetical protein
MDRAPFTEDIATLAAVDIETLQFSDALLAVDRHGAARAERRVMTASGGSLQ